MTSWLMNFASWLSEKQYIKAIRNGLIGMMPIMLIGSFCVLINNFPVPPFQQLMITIFGENWKNFTLSIYNGTIQIMALGILLSITYSLVEESNIKNSFINPIIVCLTSLGCLITITNTENDAILFTWTGATGLFIAMLTAMLATSLYVFFYQHRLFRVRLFTDAADSLVQQSLSALEPALLTFLCFSCIRLIFSYFGIIDIQVFVYDMFRDMFVDIHSSLLSAIIFTLSTQFFWFFGMHGNNVLENVSVEVWVPLLQKNIDAVEAGFMPTEILTKQFFDVFVFIGGSGATLCMIAALLIVTKKTNSSRLTRLSVPFSFFNINETLVYGLPIVMNPFYFLPFIFVPVLLALISYAAFSLGWVPYITSNVQWTTPVVMGGYIATGSWQGAMLQVFNLMVGTLCYIPFIHMAEKYKMSLNQKLIKQLINEIDYVEASKPASVVDRSDDLGILSRVLANDIQNDMVDSRGFYLVYQPQTDDSGKVIGCEALLRWNHYKLGYIPPPVVITIAEDAGLGEKLGDWVMKTAMKRQRDLYDKGFTDITMSINISPNQLKNSTFADKVAAFMKSENAIPELIELEVTENMALDHSNDMIDLFRKLQNLGVHLAIDDFGMGHSSLMYLRSFKVNTIKLDGSLIQDVLVDPQCSEIITTIVSLGDHMDLKIVAEVVETKEQVDKLKELGCKIYQGYYYSRPLVFNEFIDYITKNKADFGQ